jgi:queuine tRNA-ribosyltransferase
MLAKNSRGVNLISIHNVYYLLNLMKTLRQAILDENVQKFTEDFLSNQFMKKDSGTAKYPLWVFKALVQAKIDVKFMENKIESISRTDEEKEFFDE